LPAALAFDCYSTTSSRFGFVRGGRHPASHWECDFSCRQRAVSDPCPAICWAAGEVGAPAGFVRS